LCRWHTRPGGSASAWSVVGFAFDERHEVNRNNGGVCRRSIAILVDEHEILISGAADGDDHPTRRLQLFDEGRGDMVRGRGDEDGVKWRIRWPALIAVADSRLDVGVAKPPERCCRGIAQFWDDFDRVNLAGQQRPFIVALMTDLLTAAFVLGRAN
jgi:hypothetical protein